MPKRSQQRERRSSVEVAGLGGRVERLRTVSIGGLGTDGVERTHRTLQPDHPSLSTDVVYSRSVTGCVLSDDVLVDDFTVRSLEIDRNWAESSGARHESVRVSKRPLAVGTRISHD